MSKLEKIDILLAKRKQDLMRSIETKEGMIVRLQTSVDEMYSEIQDIEYVQTEVLK